LLLVCVLASPASGLEPTRFTIPVRQQSVSALLLRPADARALLVLAHGQAMSMEHPFMAALAAGLAERGVATLRFNFPYAEAGRKQPDPVQLLVATLLSAVRAAEERQGTLPLLLGGKSMGGAMAATATRDGALPEVRGLVILSFPLHAPNRPSAVNARALERARRPMLIVQGTRDPLADFGLMQALAEKLGAGVTLHAIRDANHGFEVPEGGRSAEEIQAEIAGAVAAFVRATVETKGE
jgi:hypothetical protein